MSPQPKYDEFDIAVLDAQMRKVEVFMHNVGEALKDGRLPAEIYAELESVARRWIRAIGGTKFGTILTGAIRGTGKTPAANYLAVIQCAEEFAEIYERAKIAKGTSTTLADQAWWIR